MTNANDRAGHSVAKRLQRASDSEFVLDGIVGLAVRGWDRISPSEFSRLYRRIRTRTMSSNLRLRGLYRGVKTVIENKVPGDVVECGTALGGSASLMALTMRRLGAIRPLWVFDTFDGLPAPTAGDPDFEIARLYTGTCVGTLNEVESFFEELQVRQGAHFVKGLFQETLPVTNISEIAFLHIDGDWYESVKVCLENLYDKVSPGGIIQFDDYGFWKGARRAVDEFLLARSIETPLERLDYSGRFLTKH